jgi:hypothetical protein
MRDSDIPLKRISDEEMSAVRLKQNECKIFLFISISNNPEGIIELL